MLTYTQCQDPQCTEPLLEISWVGQQTHQLCQQTPEEIKLREFVDAAQRGDEKAANKLEKELSEPAKPVAMGSAALWYISIGWPVFPLLDLEQARRKAKRENIPVEKALKHPGVKGGLNSATLDAETVRAWWSERPSAGIGIRSGVMFDVIDIDEERGFRSLAEIDDGIIPEVHGKVLTPRGMHLYVAATGNGNRAAVRDGIDYRGVSGFVVAPPTRILDRSYSWAVKPSPAIMRSS